MAPDHRQGGDLDCRPLIPGRSGFTVGIVRARLLGIARAAVERACRVVRASQARIAPLAAVTKADLSPVTVADFASQAVVAHSLEAELGPVSLVGEEDAALLRDPRHREVLAAVLDLVREVWVEAREIDVLRAIDLGGGAPEASGFWTLDPIDGTRGFLAGRQYAVSLAFVERGRPVVGVLGCPGLSIDRDAPIDPPDPTGSLYFAIEGEGAFAARLAGEDIRRRLVPEPEEGPIVIAESVEAAHSDRERARALLEAAGLRAAAPLRMDGQGKYAVIARGQAHAFVRAPRGDYVEKIWDHAAGALIAQEAGVVVSDLVGRPLDFSTGRRLEKNRGVIGALPELHARLVRASRAT